MRTFSLSGLSLAAILLAGCSSDVPTDSKVDIRQAVERARAAWTAQQVSDYSFLMTRTCLCTGTVRARVTVTGGVISSLSDPNTGAPFAGDDSLFRTFHGLYDYVEEALNLNAAGVSLSFVESTGVPISVTVDFVQGDVTDDVRILVEGFQPVP